MNWEQQTVLVTGGAGFIGSHLCQALRVRGASVIVLDNFSTGTTDNLSNLDTGVTVIDGSVTDETAVEQAMTGCDIVIHQAFPYGKSGMGLNDQYIDTGIDGTFNVLEQAVREDIDKLVYASSVAVYGIQEYVPLDEEHPTEPFLPYGTTKLTGEQYCRNFARLYGLDTVTLRYFYAYGPRYAQFGHNALMAFLSRALNGEQLHVYGDGTQVRDYTYISDIIAGTLAATAAETSDGRVYNISHGTGLTIRELAELVRDACQATVEIQNVEPDRSRFSDEYCRIPVGMTTKEDSEWIDERDYVADVTRAQEELDYEPAVDVREGVRRTAEWMRSNES